jgi:hypothetical protein
LEEHYPHGKLDQLMANEAGRERVMSYVNNAFRHNDIVQGYKKKAQNAGWNAVSDHVQMQEQQQYAAEEAKKENAKKIGGDLLATGFTFGVLTGVFYALTTQYFAEHITSDMMWSIVTGVGIFSLVFLWYGTKMCYQGKIGDVNTTFAVIVTLLGGGALVLNTGVIQEVTVNLSDITFYVAVGLAALGGMMFLVQIIKKCKKCNRC